MIQWIEGYSEDSTGERIFVTIAVINRGNTYCATTSYAPDIDIDDGQLVADHMARTQTVMLEISKHHSLEEQNG